jgi:hypothetical protein
MLMRRMIRLKPALLVALLATIALGPILHNHPLIPGSGESGVVQSLCVVCASGATNIGLGAPEIGAPAIVLYALEIGPCVHISEQQSVTLPSRAPPAV